MTDCVILVDENDTPIGQEEKMKAHELGLLHRAFSIFIFNAEGEMLLQKRALGKYHSAGLWTNACCSHPRLSETVLDAAHRRLAEEMGFDCELREIFSFRYTAALDHRLIENEFDHVLIGEYAADPVLNPEEACSFKWVTTDRLKDDIAKNPDEYTVWFKICLEKVATFSS